MKAATLATILLVAGCSHSEVRDAGNGMHAVTDTAAWGGYTGSHEENIEQANAFCARSGQQAVIESFQDNPGVGPKGQETSTMVFGCGARPVLNYQ
jgi:metal-dependent hydrolase (beta-lactamase superfamily II)